MTKVPKYLQTEIGQEVSRQIRPVRKDISGLRDELNRRLFPQGIPIQFIVSPGVQLTAPQTTQGAVPQPGPQAAAPQVSPQVSLEEVLLRTYGLPKFNYEMYMDLSSGVVHKLEKYPEEIKQSLTPAHLKAVIEYARNKQEDPRVYSAFIYACLDERYEKSLFPDIQIKPEELSVAQMDFGDFKPKS